MSFTWPDLLSILVNGDDLTSDQVRWAMGQILSGRSSEAQVAGFVVGLRAKGETSIEIGGLAEAMLGAAISVALPSDAVDIVGSGGDRANTVNISTMAALVAAAAGAPVVKHGNRAASSKCGTADVLEELGVALDVDPQKQLEVLEQTGITFLFAPLYHPALRHVAKPRRELGIQTTFNFLGPLANPARPRANAVGVADERMAPLMADAFAGRGARGLVFHGRDGLDELTTTTQSRVWVIADGIVSEQQLDPAELGLRPASTEDLVGGDPRHNAEVVRRLLSGEPGPVRDIVVLNGAAALLAWQGPSHDESITEQLARTLPLAQAAIDSGSGSALLESWIRVSQAAR